MSQAGIKCAAHILTQMQEGRIALLKGDKQDILLGQMLEDAKEHIKDKFAELVSMKPEKRRTRQ